MFKAFQNYLNEIDEVDILEVSQAICDIFMISYTSTSVIYFVLWSKESSVARCNNIMNAYLITE